MEIKSSADWVWVTRAALAAAGFVRCTLGGAVYWSSRRGDPANPAWVFLHGVNDQAGTWFTVAPALARERHVVLIDLPGHGESEPQQGPLTLETMLASLEAVVDHELAGTSFVLTGNSLGGWIAALYAITHPERVRHLVLEASGGLSLPFASPVTATSEEEARLVLRAVHGPSYTPPAWLVTSLIQRSSDSPMQRITGIEAHFLDRRLGEIRSPVTLLWGDEDGVLPLEYANVLRDGIPGARLEVIRGAAHIPHLQKSEEVLRCLLAIS